MTGEEEDGCAKSICGIDEEALLRHKIKLVIHEHTKAYGLRAVFMPLTKHNKKYMLLRLCTRREKERVLLAKGQKRGCK
jgi:hypothetical protein